MPHPFAALADEVQPQTERRAAITAAYRRAEAACVSALIPAATLAPAQRAAAQDLATRLVQALRGKGAHGPVEGLMREYDLSSTEGVALLCLAEALLRIPDKATRDALIRDKISPGNWHAHVGQSPSIFVNAATWGLVVTGRLVGTANEAGLTAAITRLIARGGEGLIRAGVDMAMRMLGEQFVTGQTIADALSNSVAMEKRGFGHSYDMLGEAATTADDAARYLAAYEAAIHAIGAHADRRGIYEGPGISVKLSALHPRYVRGQRGRVMAELLPRLRGLAVLARQYDIGLNIDAEEADRLDLSLDLLHALCLDPDLAGWNGIGFVVQAYQKRAPFVLDWIIDLARQTGHRLMIRLVKGAYWDSEIKRAQVDGLEGFPVFTRKIHTDVSYLACARKLLAAPDAVFPQFATHNAYTLAAIHAMAGENFYAGQYEFQCLHGMGENLYGEVVGRDKLNRPCRIYAPVGSYETLLAYLVRRLLENGANSSFVNRINDPAVSIAELVADPVAQATGAPHAKIAAPLDLFGAGRRNSIGLDLSNEQALVNLAATLAAPQNWTAGRAGASRAIHNPADAQDIVGTVCDVDAIGVAEAVGRAARSDWATRPAAGRAACLLRAAEGLEARRPALLGLIVREAGKSLANAVGEVREAVDFLRYYATAACDAGTARGPIACISPWNFPLAIFCGQVAAALAAGNPVLAKPAEETPLIAAQAVAILHAAGVPADALALLPGDGAVGAALVGDARVQAVMFTGSTEVARLIQAQLATRLDSAGQPVPLVAETGGQNALVVDSSALAEQVVADVLASAFDSAGQRCSALRVLCLQTDSADRVLDMLRGALAELVVGNPDRLASDIGPVISAEAKAGIAAHVARMVVAGKTVHQAPLPAACASGSFYPPTLIEIDAIGEIGREVFGPVLHVLRYRRDRLDRLLADIAATGYGLTFGVHSRIDETIARVTARAPAGNIYINRNLIGAVVGVQPFGGHGLSGTGPKAGGPLYLQRLRRDGAAPASLIGQAPAIAADWRDWLLRQGQIAAAAVCSDMLAATPLGLDLELPGPVGERNLYRTTPRGTVLCLPGSMPDALRQISAALATGNRARVGVSLPDLPAHLGAWIESGTGTEGCDAVLASGGQLARVLAELVAQPGPIVPVWRMDAEDAAPLAGLVLEQAISTNTTAAGGNAHLMTIG